MYEVPGPCGPKGTWSSRGAPYCDVWVKRQCCAMPYEAAFHWVGRTIWNALRGRSRPYCNIPSPISFSSRRSSSVSATNRSAQATRAFSSRSDYARAANSTIILPGCTLRVRTRPCSLSWVVSGSWIAITAVRGTTLSWREGSAGRGLAEEIVGLDGLLPDPHISCRSEIIPRSRRRCGTRWFTREWRVGGRACRDARVA